MRREDDDGGDAALVERLLQRGSAIPGMQMSSSRQPASGRAALQAFRAVPKVSTSRPQVSGAGERVAHRLVVVATNTEAARSCGLHRHVKWNSARHGAGACRAARNAPRRSTCRSTAPAPGRPASWNERMKSRLAIRRRPRALRSRKVSAGLRDAPGGDRQHPPGRGTCRAASVAMRSSRGYWENRTRSITAGAGPASRSSPTETRHSPARPAPGPPLPG